MKPVYSVLSAMANDKRISDRCFREAIKELFGEESRGESFTDKVRSIAMNAIYETERERFVH